MPGPLLPYRISTDPGEMDVDAIHAFLSGESYWARGIPRETVARSIANSLPFGVFDTDGAQVAFARVVTDRATFAYLADVYVLPAHRGRGISRWMMQAVSAHPELQGLRRWMLMTQDATAYTPASAFSRWRIPSGRWNGRIPASTEGRRTEPFRSLRASFALPFIPPMIDLRTPLSLRSSFAFPLQTVQARREVLLGAAWLLVPLVGWLMNMGHRVVMVHRMMAGEPAWPAWRRPGQLVRHGLVTFGGMAYYYLPGAALTWAGWRMRSPAMMAAGGVLLVLATLAIPGYMTHYCRAFDPREIYDPVRALSRALQGGRAYWRAWGIALCALALSFVGLIGLGVGFLATSVWFWQVAGFSFARVFSQRYILPADAAFPSGGAT